MLATFPLLIDYAQVLVYASDHPAPGLLWTDAHVAQGFAWAEGVVSFGVPDHDGDCLVEVDARAFEGVGEEALWAIQVPFEVTGPVMVGSVFTAEEVAVPEGTCDLVFEAYPGGDDQAFRLRLTFSPASEGSFAILRQGGDVTADHVLMKTAEPAA